MNDPVGANLRTAIIVGQSNFSLVASPGQGEAFLTGLSGWPDSRFPACFPDPFLSETGKQAYRPTGVTHLAFERHEC